MPTQADKGVTFRALHEGTGAFIIPNPWDVGTARILARLGFPALATTSAGYAFSVGRADNAVPRAEMLAHVGAIAAATNLPVSGDLGNGFGDSPEVVAETIKLAAQAGLVGASIEDAVGNRVYEIGHAADRVRAASEVVRSLQFPFMLTARAENHLVGRPDLRDTVKRLQAFQEAGANVLYAPGLSSKGEITAVVRSTDRPLNVLMGVQGAKLSLAELSAMGVKRISVGSALARASLTVLLRASREMLESGTFEFADGAVSYRELNSMFELGPVAVPAEAMDQ